MNEELLDSMLVKPLPKKYDKSNNTFFFAQSKSDEEFLDSKIIDERDKFSKKQYNKVNKYFDINTRKLYFLYGKLR